ncbi:MAG TPA: hypothetical protein VM577_03495 [Anaerovoracaceae bacterium]|nr:hypothetical protein [Anaerovoracaceae bacterium]
MDYHKEIIQSIRNEDIDCLEDGQMFKSFSTNLRNNFEIAFAAYLRADSCLRFLGEELKDNEKFFLEIIQNENLRFEKYGWDSSMQVEEIISYASDRIRETLETVIISTPNDDREIHRSNYLSAKKAIDKIMLVEHLENVLQDNLYKDSRTRMPVKEPMEMRNQQVPATNGVSRTKSNKLKI